MNTIALFHFLGWQRESDTDSINQVSEQTGVDASTLIYNNDSSICKHKDYLTGKGAAKCLDLDRRLDYYLPKFYGNIEFWLGVRDSS